MITGPEIGEGWRARVGGARYDEVTIQTIPIQTIQTILIILTIQPNIRSSDIFICICLCLQIKI